MLAHTVPSAGGQRVGEIPESSELGIDAGGRFDQRHGDQGDAQVSDLDEHPLQLRLVGDDAGKTRRSIGFLGQGEVAEPGCPVLVQVPFDPKLVGGRHMPSGRRGHENPTFAVALMLRLLMVGRLMMARRRADRRMTYSATARLMTQPAPRQRSVVSSLVRAFPMPWVNTWVPAPRARAYARVIHARWRLTAPRRIAAKPRTMLTAMPDPNAMRNTYASRPVPGWWG